MKNRNSLYVIVLCLITLSCGDKNLGENAVFGFDESKLKEQYLPNDVVELSLKNSNNKKIDSIVYFLNDKNVGSKKGFEKFSYTLKDQKLGYQHLKALVYFEGKTETDTTRIELVTDVLTKQLKYKVLNMYPHDTTSFTEGLEFYKDELYESTGQYKVSKLMKVDYKTGKILKSINLDDQYFGEGITILNDKIYQLTYKEKVGFIYDVNTFKLEKTFVNDKLEGWGMTNDGKDIYLNDSSEKIWKMNALDQKTFDYINVYTGSNKVKAVNELEWIDGKIYGNIWQKDAIAIINPATGAVESVLDMKDLKKSVSNKNADVLNGIAYNPKTKTIFVTGKNWDKIFEIVIVK
jgi:glutaminyl-peptide cyclotransferase